jgi:phospholipid/cholesterol/gamma-HCH transport system ATP-binding protein
MVVESSPAADSPVIEFRDVHKAFSGKPVLRGLSLAVRPGEIMFIIGTSGVGKSVTIKHLIGLLTPDRGECWFEGRRVDGLREAELFEVRKRMAMVFQSSTLFDSLTLLENVALPLQKHRKLSERAAEAEAMRYLDQVQLKEFAHRSPAEVGDGIRKRAAIARALTMSPRAVLFDEPTTGLDPVSARRVDRLIQRLAHGSGPQQGPGSAGSTGLAHGSGPQQGPGSTGLARDSGVTCIVVSHDLVSIFSIADRICFIYRGAAHVVATPAELRASTDPVVQQFISGRSDGPMETPGF